MRCWKVVIGEVARQQLTAINDIRIRDGIAERINRLQFEPEKQGKALKDELTGCRSVRAIGQRYRIIFKIEEELVLITVVTVGIRKEGDKKDAYALAKKLARLNMLR
jgi:mRNA interferase RelE/StbE